MDGPWYEYTGPSIDDARKEFKNFKLDKVIVPSSIVERCIQREYEKNGNFGSWRGWATFSRRNIIQDCGDEFINLNILSLKLKENRILLHWVNDRLYKPGGMRYNQVRDEFNSCN